MNLGDVLNIFNLIIADKVPDSEDMTPERFQTLLTYAQKKHFEAKVTKKHWDSLRPFTVILGYNGSMSLPIDKDGVAAIPAGYKEHKSTSHRYMKSGALKFSQVRKVDDQKWDELISSHVEYPNRQYPILNIKDTYVRFMPVDLRYVTFTYIKTPEDPVFGVNYDDGYPKYDSSLSTELLWDDENILDMIFIMSRDLGIIVTIDDVKTASEQPKTKKK